MKRLLYLTLLLLPSQLLLGAEIWVPMFRAVGATVGCHRARWNSDVVFYNQNAAAVVVTLLDISNGTVPSDVPTTLLVPARSALSVQANGLVWAPPPPSNDDLGYRLWTMHLDVPSGVVVDASDLFVDEQFCPAPEPSFGPTMKVSLPVFTSLAPAGTPQVKTGTDIGTTPARQNVTIYNAGAQSATAQIEIRRSCDGSLMDARTVTLPPRTTIQFGGFTTGTSSCITNATSNYMRYTVITVDQPNVSYVSTIATQPTTSTLVPTVELGVK